MEGFERPPEEEGTSAPNKTRLNTFQPLGRYSSKDRSHLGTSSSKVLELVSARKPEQAKIGEIVRFIYNPGDGHSAYWLQGTLEKRLDKYSVARASKFRKNRFRINKLKIVN